MKMDHLHLVFAMQSEGSCEDLSNDACTLITRGAHIAMFIDHTTLHGDSKHFPNGITC